MILELKPKYENKKSYYGKATLQVNEHNNINKVIDLYSYNKHILTIAKKYITFENNINLYTNTTMRHVRELIRQYAGTAQIPNITKKFIIKNNFKILNIFNSHRTLNREYMNFNQCKINNYK